MLQDVSEAAFGPGNMTVPVWGLASPCMFLIGSLDYGIWKLSAFVCVLLVSYF